MSELRTSTVTLACYGKAILSKRTKQFKNLETVVTPGSKDMHPTLTLNLYGLKGNTPIVALTLAHPDEVATLILVLESGLEQLKIANQEQLNKIKGRG